MENNIEELKKKLFVKSAKRKDKQITRRPYKNQKEKDLELCKAYQLGINDERKQWQEVKKENALLKYREKKYESFCFCKGDPLWRWACAECQNWFKEELKRRTNILKRNSKKKIIEGSWGGIFESIVEISFAPHSNSPSASANAEDLI